MMRFTHPLFAPPPFFFFFKQAYCGNYGAISILHWHPKFHYLYFLVVMESSIMSLGQTFRALLVLFLRSGWRQYCSGPQSKAYMKPFFPLSEQQFGAVGPCTKPVCSSTEYNRGCLTVSQVLLSWKARSRSSNGIRNATVLFTVLCQKLNLSHCISEPFLCHSANQRHFCPLFQVWAPWSHLTNLNSQINRGGGCWARTFYPN